MTQNYNADAEVVAEAMDAVYENKQANKKNDMSGDYSNDNASYPTIKAVRGAYGTKKTSWASTPSNDDVPSEKLVKDSLDGKLATNIGSSAGKILTTGTNGVIQASDNLSTGDVKDSTAHSHIGSSANATQSTINSAIDNMVNLDVVKQSTADTGYASTYYLTQNGVQVGAKIQIEKDKMLRSISVETVGATPTTEESTYSMTTGDQYIKMVVNTVDNDGTTNVILPITDVFDLQTADEVTLTVSSGGVFSIKNGGVDTAQLKDGAVTADKIASPVKNGWLTNSDVQSEISAFATALANTINPPSNGQ